MPHCSREHEIRAPADEAAFGLTTAASHQNTTTGRGDHEAGCHHGDGYRLVHRKQHPGSACEPSRGEVRNHARGQICRARLPLPGAGRARRSIRPASSTGARCASSAKARPGIMSRWSRRSRIPASSRRTFPISAPASSWAPADRRRAPSSRPPTSPAPRGRSGSGRSRCRRRCRRPRRRRSPPGSRSRA